MATDLELIRRVDVVLEGLAGDRADIEAVAKKFFSDFSKAEQAKAMVMLRAELAERRVRVAGGVATERATAAGAIGRETARLRSELRLGEKLQTEGFRATREVEKLGRIRQATSLKQLRTAADKLASPESRRGGRQAFTAAKVAFLGAGGDRLLANAIEEEAVVERRAGIRKRLATEREQRIKDRPKRIGAKEGTIKAQRSQLSRLGIGEETKIPGRQGVTIAETLGSKGQRAGIGARGQKIAAVEGAFGAGLRKIQGRTKLLSGLKRGGLIGVAGGIGTTFLIRAIMGGKDKEGPELDPLLQMQLMQSLQGARGRPTDPALTQGRELRNVFQLLQIIKTLQGLQGVMGQPSTGGLV